MLIEQLLKFWFVVPIILILAVFKTAWFKGIFGEFLVNTLARFQLSKKSYHVIKNVTLPTEDGTTQIDHVIVSVYGVFVVETKNMKGWIFGGERQKTWTQKIYKHSQKFQNPLHQNYKHIKTLQSLLALTDNQLHSLVVFIGDSTFKTETPKNVTHGMGYIRYIKSKTQMLLSEQQVQTIIEQIETERYPRTLKTQRDHIKHVKDIQSKDTKKESKINCPKCGSEMLLRTAKKGQNAGNQFWGCSTYPRCKGTLTIEK